MEEIIIEGEVFYKISNTDTLRPFFMSIVSDSNHWMFVSSNGGISAGRKDAEHALFPYYTDDKITESAEYCGSKTIVRVFSNGHIKLWEPFSERSTGLYNCTRNLYKSCYSNSIIFEEINEDLGISFQYRWNSSNLYGFVRRAKLVNHHSQKIQIQLLDGLQNVLPYGAGSELQKNVSNLANAYKRSELISESGSGIFALSAIIVDKAEPSEALKANVVWGAGLTRVNYLLSSLQLNQFRTTGTVQQEEDVKGEKGSYFVQCDLQLQPMEEHEWMMVADVNQNHSSIIQLSESIINDSALKQKVLNDVKEGTENLVKLVAASDGIQSSADGLKNSRHFSNTLFNIMRGGIFDANYTIEKWDFSNYLHRANKRLFAQVETQLQQLGDIVTVFEINAWAAASGNEHLQRLTTEYLPLKFSRRHGDPSRPWNKFTINTRSETDGSKILDYEGNWRDIFQNWEALVHAYPAFIEGMISKFLNASTFDGYNPYRVTKFGFDWETIEPDNPWSYIGYWGDHQIIYLLKFLEFLQQYQPGKLHQLLHTGGFVYANVPYLIKSYEDICANPKETIVFNHHADRHIREQMQKIGFDGALLTNAKNEIHTVSFGEKILATVLSKLSNFVPEGGIWMNTQRPEWNDANNALVGNGLSMVTLCYLRRFLQFFQSVLKKYSDGEISVSEELHNFFIQIAQVFKQNNSILSASVSDDVRKRITDALGEAGSNYRSHIYKNKFSGSRVNVTAKEILQFFITAAKFLEQSIDVNKRKDHLFHTYNLISYNEHTITVSHLSEMLEGQVAALSSGYLTAQQSLQLLDALQQSVLYRKDQNSYILYPNKELPKFLLKNTIPKKAAEQSVLFQQLLRDGNVSIIEKDCKGEYHFNGNFRNANDAADALKNLNLSYQSLVEKEKAFVLQTFEEVFRHKEFTGRSGTFFGYEGLGSIYWHMVSKLLLAVQETCLNAIEKNADEETISKLIAHYYNIYDGIGVHKSPQLYGAFTTDPYSHTPINKGAQQPGMTGQVKEDILCRAGELGIVIKDGKLCFNPVLLLRNELKNESREINYVDVNGRQQNITLQNNSLFFTFCQVPVVYTLSDDEKIELVKADGSITTIASAVLPEKESKEVFERTGTIQLIKVAVNEKRLR